MRVMKWLMMIMVVMMAQRAFAQPATSAVPFLLIAPDSRAGGFGEGGVAMAGKDPNTIFWNPAALYRIQDMQLSITHANWLPEFNADLFYDYLAMTYPLGEDLGTLGGHFTFLNLGEHIRTDATGNELGRFTSWEFAVGVSYGVPITDDWSIGLGARFIYSRLSPFGTAEEGGKGISSGFGMDIATEYHPTDLVIPFIDFDLSNRFRFGASITNIGPAMTYIDEKQADPIPTNFRAGVSYRVIDDEYYYMDTYVEMAKLLVSRDSTEADPFYKAMYSAWVNDGFSTEMTKANLMFGGEFVYDNFISLRAGYFYEHKNYGNRRFMTYGAGIIYDFLRADFSYISAFEERHPLAGTVRISLGLILTKLF